MMKEKWPRAVELLAILLAIQHLLAIAVAML